MLAPLRHATGYLFHGFLQCAIFDGESKSYSLIFLTGRLHNMSGGQVSELCISENSHKKRDINNKLATCNLSHTNIGLTLIIMNLKNREIVIQYSYRQWPIIKYNQGETSGFLGKIQTHNLVSANPAAYFYQKCGDIFLSSILLYEDKF